MSRLVEHDENGPVRLDTDDIDEEHGDIAICRCGLSNDRPFCDGSHRVTDGEDEDEQYWYVHGERHVVDLVRRSE